MKRNATQKIIAAHLVSGSMTPGEPVAIKIDQTLTQDATGTMAYLQFEAMGIPRVRTEVSVSYVDHNTLQTGFENADDHRYLQSVAARYGIFFSRPGNGICHQVHLERFAVPGKTLLGSDSHTPTAGGLGMLAIGAGGLDVAVAMGGGAFHLTMPKVVGVTLTGRLPAWVSAKDIILEILRRLTVRGGVGRVFEYLGDGARSLSVFERATITNMGTELGATSSLFFSDENTREFLRWQGREKDWVAIEADVGCAYDEHLEVDLSALEPLIARPHSPDAVVPVREVEGIEPAQVCIGSCTNSSYVDLMTVAAMVRGRKVHPRVSLTVSPGSRQVFDMIARNGALADLIAAGARILECACGPCIGMGQAPPTGGVSIRTFNRNFRGRSGTPDAEVYLCSPQVAVAAAIEGRITDPRKWGAPPSISPAPSRAPVDDSMILAPADRPDSVVIERGPNIKPCPTKEPMPESLRGQVLLVVGDNITTDHIMPAGAKVLPLRSNIPAISQYVFGQIDAGFVARAKAAQGGFVVGGINYGQGSSREHAALAPMFLGVMGVLARSFARIHRSNLINFGILPMTFADDKDASAVEQGDVLEIPDVRNALRERAAHLTVRNVTKGRSIRAALDLSEREADILVEGGLLNYTRAQGR